MTEKQSWRCKWCKCLNKERAHRCGKCDYLWHVCIDRSFVPGQRAQSKKNWKDDTWYQPPPAPHGPRKGSKSPKGKRNPTPKGKKKKKEDQPYAMPELDPPWNGKTSAPSSGQQIPTDPQVELRVEQKLNRLVAALEKQEGPLDPEVQQIMEESTEKPPSSKTMHSAVAKRDQARKKLQQAQTARQNHQNKWAKYIEDSVARWKTFAEAFAKQDKELEEKVNTAKNKLQEVTNLLDDVKEKLSKQDEEVLRDTEIISDVEEEQDKMDTSEQIQQGIDTMVATLERIRVRPEQDESQVSKKQRTGVEPTGHGSGAAAPGTRMLEPFAGAGK